MAKLIIEPHELLDGRHGQAHRAPVQRLIVERDFLIENLRNLIETRRHGRCFFRADAGWVHALERLHIVDRFDFHGAGQDKEIVSLCGKRWLYGSNKFPLCGVLKLPAQTRLGFCKKPHKTSRTKNIYLYKSTSCDFFLFGTAGAKGVPIETISIAPTLRKKSWISLLVL
ncbi:hypothetical protein LUW10_03710 [Pseudomonas veronii]|uniref:hypothetical protein n=1 Tax=Pseudomonas veronii TaxID=76761 RepID=UPI001E57037A|nr:hypothetical protein [Pseudomonas veronii]UHH30946.1 hypothetical protein LUW10_03710 [Pseudomonas veronii]